MSWEPKILGLLCNWCAYQGADLAGTSRMRYAHNLRIVRLMCSGRADATAIMHALKGGADGVLIAGCHPGDCHYVDGNVKTMRRIPLLKKMLMQLGVEEDRIRLAWVSAAEADEFVKIVTEMTERIRELGPFSINGRVAAAEAVEAEAEAVLAGAPESETQA